MKSARFGRFGTSLKSRILLHNSGQNAVIFSVPSWQQSASHTAHDALGAVINVSSTYYWTTMARKLTYRLAPGEYCETPAPGIGVGAKTEDEDWANVRVGAWIDAKQADEVRFSPGAVEVRCSPSVIGTRMMDGRPVNVDPKDAADLWAKIVAERVARELPLPAAAAEREQIIRRVTLDLFGEPPTPEEIAAFVADEAVTAQAALEKRLRQRPGLAPFTGTLPPGDIQFHVLAADPDAAKRPRVVTGPGYYILGDNERLHVERTPHGQRRTEEDGRSSLNGPLIQRLKHAPTRRPANRSNRKSTWKKKHTPAPIAMSKWKAASYRTTMRRSYGAIGILVRELTRQARAISSSIAL